MSAETSQPAIKIENLTKSFGDKVLRGIDLEVAPGQILGYVRVKCRTSTRESRQRPQGLPKTGESSSDGASRRIVGWSAADASGQGARSARNRLPADSLCAYRFGRCLTAIQVDDRFTPFST